jgi:hypothetical protein
MRRLMWFALPFGAGRALFAGAWALWENFIF